MRLQKENNDYLTELYKILYNNIRFADRTKEIRSVLITSAAEGEGKTTVASNLAISMAKSGKKTLLIDYNLANPSIHKIFALSYENDAAANLRGYTEDRETVIQSGIDGLCILLPMSLKNTSKTDELCEKMKELLSDFKSQYDFVIVDAPAVMHASYVQLISQYADGCIMVVGADNANMKDVKKSKELLEKANARILGAVFNASKGKAVHEKSILRRKVGKHEKTRSKNNNVFLNL